MVNNELSLEDFKGTNIEKSFKGSSLSSEMDEWLEKGKALPIGTERTWKGKPYVKMANGWQPKKGGGNRGFANDEEEDAHFEKRKAHHLKQGEDEENAHHLATRDTLHKKYDVRDDVDEDGEEIFVHPHTGEKLHEDVDENGMPALYHKNGKEVSKRGEDAPPPKKSGGAMKKNADGSWSRS